MSLFDFLIPYSILLVISTVLCRTMNRLKLTLCSVKTVSALEEIPDTEIAKTPATSHQEERSERFVKSYLPLKGQE